MLVLIIRQQLKLCVPYVILPVLAIWLTVCSSEESINGDIMLAMKFCMSLIRVFHVWMLARAHIVFKVIHCGNYGGNLAGQQLVCNRDPFRVQTSFPAAPWELHHEWGEEGNWGWVGWTQEVITICIEIGLTSVSTLSPPYPESDWTRQMLVEAESRDVGGGKMTAVHCLSTPAIVWNGKGRRKERRREKRERELLIAGVWNCILCRALAERPIIWLN